MPTLERLRASSRASDPKVLGDAPVGLDLNEELFTQLMVLFQEEETDAGTHLLEPFLARGDAQVAALWKALTFQDREGLAFGAHALKGAARTLGFQALGCAAEQLERDAASAPQPQLGRQVEAVDAGFRKVRGFLRLLLGKPLEERPARSA